MQSDSNRSHRTAATVAAALLAVGASAAKAAGVASDAAVGSDAEASAEAESPSEIIVTGTRQQGIVAAESAAPIQIIGSQELASTGKPNLIDALAQLVPSFQAQGFGADLQNQTLQARLYGLSPNHVLVLVDGKRRHTTANLAVDPGSPYSGGAGVDLNFIPLAAIDHIEVLTEGAAAQYGSDAIAGVINVILKKSSHGGTAEASYGGFFDGGGSTTQVDANAGFQPLEDSYFNITGQVFNHGHTDRGNIDPRMAPSYWTGSYPNSNIPLVPGYPNLNQIQGDAETHYKLASYNTGFKLGQGIELYSFGTYGTKDAASFENYRVPGKVVYNPDSTPTPGYTPPPAGTVVATYPLPDGFNPLEQAKENDFELVAGLKGAIGDWTWDLAEAYGEDHMDVFTINSANAGLYAATGATPSNFFDGKFISTQSTTTLDITKDFNFGLAGPVTLAAGAEHRRQTYVIGPGDTASYVLGGAQSFPGYPPTVATNASRKSEAGYVDLAATPITGLRLDLAGRYESYSDFGNATVGKLTARYDVVPQFAVRGTVSSGFRAPSLLEEHYTNVNVGPTTAFVQLAPNAPSTGLLGLGGGLKPEHSTNISFGIVLRPIESVTATIDAYQILVTNRIVPSGNIFGQTNGTVYPGSVSIPCPANGGATESVISCAIAGSGLAIDPQVLATGTTGINLFANGIDTRTRGVDFTLQSPMDLPVGHVDWSIGATYNYTVITREITAPALLGGQPLFDPLANSSVTTQSPRAVVNLGAHYTISQFYVNLHEVFYGPSSDFENDDGDGPTGAAIYYPDRIGSVAITNLELGLKLKEHFTVAFGANNLFNRYPNQTNPKITATEAAAYDNTAVQKYLPFSPFGIDGGFYYARASFSF